MADSEKRIDLYDIVSSIADGDTLFGVIAGIAQRVTIAILRAQLNTGNQSILGGLNVSDDVTFQKNLDILTDLLVNGDTTLQDLLVNGDLTATNLFGNGSGLTGITGATGGIANTGSTTIGADTDVDGNGIVSLQTRNLDRLKVENDGTITVVQGMNDLPMNNKHFIASQTILNQTTEQFYWLDGVNDYLSIADNANLDFGTGDFSTIISFRTNATFAGNAFLFNKQAGAVGYWAYFDPTGKVNFNINDGSGNATSTSNSVLNDGKWHTVCAIFDRSETLDIYIDGKLQTDRQSLIPRSASISNAASLLIGAQTGPTGYFTGDIKSKIILFNRVLTADEAITFSSNPQMALDYADEGGSNVAMNVSNCENGLNGLGASNQYDTFDGVSATGFHAVKTTTGSGNFVAGTNDEIVAAKGKKIHVVVNIALASGVMPTCNILTSLGGTGLTASSQTLTEGENIIDFEITATDITAVVQFTSLSANQTEFTISSLSVTQLGATVVYKGLDFTEELAKDSSGNDNHAIVSGATLCNKSDILTPEFGSFTPSIDFSTSVGDLSYDIQFGRYQKKGSVCKILSLLLQADQTTASGNITIIGLPYTSKNTANQFVVVGIKPKLAGAAGKIIMGLIQPNSSIITLQLVSQDNSTAVASLTDAEIGESNFGFNMIPFEYEIQE